MLATASADAQAVKIGVVDLNKITQEYNKSKAGYAEMKAEEARVKRELEAEWANYEKLIEEANRIGKQFSDPAANPEIRKQKLAEANQLIEKAKAESKRMQEAKAQKEGAFMKRYAQLVESVLKEVGEATAAVANERGVALVFDASGKTTHASALIQFHDPSVDLTSDVLARLNPGARKP